MKCPECESRNTEVLETRESGSGEMVRRRRSCIDCKARWTTRETYDERRKAYLDTVKRFHELTDRRKQNGLGHG